MSLFDAEILREYRSDTRIVKALGGVRLFNLDEFLGWFYNEVRVSPRTTSASRLHEVETENFARRQKSATVLRELANTICVDSSGRPAINRGYGIDAINNLLNRSTNFDVIFAIRPAGFRSKTIAPSRNPNLHDPEKFDAICGFIITEQGECPTKPTVYSINLICASAGIKSLLMLGAYLFCIKNSPHIVQEGILELAGGYTNMSGFISYTKMGFNKDLTMDCLAPISNLPMTVNIDELTNDIIIRRASGQIRREVENITEDDSGLYNIASAPVKLPPSQQNRLELYNNVLYKIQMFSLTIIDNSRDNLTAGEEMVLDETLAYTGVNRWAINYLLDCRYKILIKAYPHCKRGRCQEVRHFFGLGNKRRKKGTIKGKNKGPNKGHNKGTKKRLSK